MSTPLPDDDAAERAERLAEVDAWLADLEPGCDGWYIQTRLVRWLRDELETLAAEGDFDQASDATIHFIHALLS